MRILPLLAVLSLGAAPLTSQTPLTASGPSADDLAAGERLFESQCTRCHGVGGTGGVGPALTRPRLRRAATDAALVQVILGGIPGTAMIGFWNLTEDEGRQVAEYVRSLGRRPPEVIPGDPHAGERLYRERGQCQSCHILNGQGVGWAPDLSEVGLRLQASQLRESLLRPGAAQPVIPLPSAHGPYPAYLMVEVTLSGGRVIKGTRITEDDFTLVLRQTDGKLRSIEKTGIRRLRKLFDASPMPAYGEAFTDAELDDLVAYLAGLRGEP